MISKLMMKKLYQLFLPVIFLGGILYSTGAEAYESVNCDDRDKNTEEISVPLPGSVSIVDIKKNLIFDKEIYPSFLKTQTKSLSYGFSLIPTVVIDSPDWRVFSTAMKGINMVAKRGNTFFPSKTVPDTESKSVWFRLFKNSGLEPGKFDGSSLPVLCINRDGKAKVIIKFTGTLEITEPTCTAIDPPPVNMKNHGINEFTGKDSGTRWLDASIVLTECQYAPSLSISISPVNGANDPKKGIMEIDSSGDAAKGIGIQLRYGLTGNSFVEFGKKHKLNKSMSTGLGIKIPLSARYIQTEDRVTPGIASGRVTYTMSYY
ncbi:type 1 fimbrial protein [Xenorhabdus sp. Vera]|uniref:fimbrial protein n=1 Tax=Xenorhabdus koppenhoeferi TaxID=351659 RepID=UPI001982BE1C|nr:fimbrial protein [Xenorhabdus sp. Vera]MBD2810771.1 type 1 fimbrial protein [Xenorhabdus sp. Vera]